MDSSTSASTFLRPPDEPHSLSQDVYNPGFLPASATFLPADPMFLPMDATLHAPPLPVLTLELEVARLQAQNRGLMRENEILKRECNNLRQNHNSTILVSRPDDPLAPLQQADFPNVKFWFKRDWPGKKASDELGVHGFVDMVDSSIVTEERFDKIRKFACTFWMALKAEGNPPPKWAGASMDIKNRYYGELRSNYPELKLCDNNWKADYIASLYYGHWYNYHITHKQSAYINSTAESVSTTSRKRRRTAKSSTGHAANPGFPVAASLDSGQTNFDANENFRLAMTMMPTASSEPAAGEFWAGSAENTRWRGDPGPEFPVASLLDSEWTMGSDNVNLAMTIMPTTTSLEPLAVAGGSSTFGLGHRQVPCAINDSTIDEWKLFEKFLSEQRANGLQ